MDAKGYFKVGSCPSSIDHAEVLIDKGTFVVERIFSNDADRLYCLRVTKIIDNIFHFYYLSFDDIISMFACINFLSTFKVNC